MAKTESILMTKIQDVVNSLEEQANKASYVQEKLTSLLLKYEQEEKEKIDNILSSEENTINELFSKANINIREESNKKITDENVEYNKKVLNEKNRYEQSKLTENELYSKKIIKEKKRHEDLITEAKDEYDQLSSNLRVESETLAGQHHSEWLPWSAPFWNEFVPIKTIQEPPLTRFGELTIASHEKVTNFPALLRIITGKNILINATGAQKDETLAVLQSIMLRLLVTLPAGKSNFILIDPVGLGANMAGFMHLPPELVGSKIWTEPNHIEQQLIDLSGYMETIIQKYLRNNFNSMEEYNNKAGEVAEPYRFLVITNFPANFTETAAQRLISIASNGPRTGVYVLVMRDTSMKMPYNFNITELERLSTIISYTESGPKWEDPYFNSHNIAFDALPSTEVFNRLLGSIGEESKLAGNVEVPFDIILKELPDYWCKFSDEGLITPIGRAGARNLQLFSIGKGTLQHVLIAGKTGSGKSNLLHVIIMSLCVSYSPDELELYLIDFKKGIEFKTYASMKLPHAKVIAIQSEREFGLSVLQGLDAELQRRGDLFRDSGVQNLKEFRTKNPETKMRRIVLLVDEFHEFFSEDDQIASHSARLFDRLVRQGRAFGIHVILASQALSGVYQISRATSDQMAIRIALQCSEADSTLILGNDNPSARLLSRPGEAIYNDANGLIEGNTLFQALYLSDDRRNQYLIELHDRYIERYGKVAIHQMVFEGNAPSNLETNALLANLLSSSEWPLTKGGINIWLGEPIAIKNHTSALLKEQSRSNLIVVGQNEEVGSAMLVSAIISIAAHKSPANVEFHIIDFSTVDFECHKTINNLPNYLRYPIHIHTKRNANSAIEAVDQILINRESAENDPLSDPSVFVFIFGIHRARDWRSNDGYTFPEQAEHLFHILATGPDFGIHTLCWGDTVKNIEKVISRNMSEFDFRVGMQMSINESNDLIDSQDANKLGQYRALFYDEEKTGKLEKFRPYALPDESWLQIIGKQLELKNTL
jgi:DNA segregation ATPase FtsK/SpoIIIE, S-DNA-T family